MPNFQNSSFHFFTSNLQFTTIDIFEGAEMKKVLSLTRSDYLPAPSPTPSPTPYHNACVNQTCQSVVGSGSDTCIVNTDCIPSPTPTPSPSYSIQDFKNLLLNYLTSADGSYLPVDQKVNLLDGGYVIKWLH